MNLSSYFKDRKLLADGYTNTKIAKNTIRTYTLSLVPHTINAEGVNLCPFSTKECRSMCLNMSGRGGFSVVQEARKRKADYFVKYKPHFLDKLYQELDTINGRGEKCLVRLNMISDVNWNKEFQSVGKDIRKLKNITFYGYTKDPYQILGNNLPNQHLTFSYSGGNWRWCERFLSEQLANVAVVFKNSLPLVWRGYKVIDGTLDDERINDEKGVIVGLKYKVPRGVKYQKNKFVVENVIE